MLTPGKARLAQIGNERNTEPSDQIRMIEQRERKSEPTSLQIAAALQEIAVLLKLKGGRYFQARAYDSAARVVAQLGDSIDALMKENRLRSIAGIGDAIARQIEDLHQTGNSWLLDRLRSERVKSDAESVSRSSRPAMSNYQWSNPTATTTSCCNCTHQGLLNIFNDVPPVSFC
jgi:hypothetical protein